MNLARCEGELKSGVSTSVGIPAVKDAREEKTYVWPEKCRISLDLYVGLCILLTRSIEKYSASASSLKKIATRRKGIEVCAKKNRLGG